MRVRALVLGVALIGAALGVAGCSSSGGKASAGPPTGTVTVRSGNKVVCVITLKNGTGQCKVTTAGYTPGKVTYTGTFNGTISGKVGIGKASTTVTIVPAKPAGPVASSAAPTST